MKTKATFEQKIVNWLANGETGISSEAIAFMMLGIVPGRSMAPCDPSDFKRCLKLIIEVPEIRPRLNEMKVLSKDWERLIDNWEEVERSFMEEVEEWLTNDFSQKRATKTYNLMKKIYEDQN